MNKEQGGFCRSEYGIHIQQKASTRKGKCLKEVGLLGFEPRKTGPESVVLPLHHSPNEKIAPPWGQPVFKEVGLLGFEPRSKPMF